MLFNLKTKAIYFIITRLANKIAVISGSSGIGKMSAKLFARKGAKVVIVGRSRNLLEDTESNF